MIEATVKEQTKATADPGLLEVVYYTDPLCCWSWTMEQHWQKVKETYKDILSVRYCMGGLIESWNSYHDTENAVSKPVQMGPIWMQAAHIGQVVIDHTLWVKDPPMSSYLTCVAVKCAELQSPAIGEQFLCFLRQQVMVNGRNIAKLSIITALAEEFQKQCAEFNLSRFSEDVVNGNGNKAFTADLQEVRYRNISRFPTLSISDGKNGILMTGYRSYENILEAIEGLRTRR